MLRGVWEGDLNQFQSRESQENTCIFDIRNKTLKETDKGEGGFVLGREDKIKVELPLFLCSFLIYKFICVNKWTWHWREGWGRKIVNRKKKGPR